MMIVDLTEMEVRQKYAEMLKAVMYRVQAAALDASASHADVAELLTAYADVVRATSGGDV